MVLDGISYPGADGAYREALPVFAEIVQKLIAERMKERRIYFRRPCLVRNCAREQGPITTGRYWATRWLNKDTDTTRTIDDTAYGSPRPCAIAH